MGGRGKLPKFANFHPAIPLNSARKAPLASSPQRKPELCVAPEPKRPDTVPAFSKVGGSQAGESAGAGRKGAAVSPGEAGAWRRWPAGGSADNEQTHADRLVAGGPSTPSRAALDQKTTPAESPGPPGRSPFPTLARLESLGPAAQPSALPGGPAYLSEASCLGEGSAEPGEPRAKRRSPQPLALTQPPQPRAGRAQCHPTPRLLGKARTAAPPPLHRTVRSQAAPARARPPAGGFGA